MMQIDAKLIDFYDRPGCAAWHPCSKRAFVQSSFDPDEAKLLELLRADRSLERP
jgi:hypothetical protein